MKKLIIMVGLLLFLSALVFAQPQRAQIIAVATFEKTESGQISDKAARAPYYLVFDKSGKLLEIISNPFRDAAGGAGPKMADLLAEKNVTIVVAGAFGYKMAKALEAKGIKHHEATGIVKKAVEELLR
jgi:predicted Fe-Mo cluster-binding NifX family protein